MRPWMRACLRASIAAATLGYGVASAEPPADTIEDEPSAENTLPPLTEPSVDVPTRPTPQPPRNADQPPPTRAELPPAPPHETAKRAAPEPPLPPPAKPAPASPRAVAAARPGDTITPRPCRVAIYNVVIEGRPQRAWARLCQMPDGAWQISP
jgi:hypothetical protein